MAFVDGLRDSRGLEVVPMAGDGACLFRAVAYHVMGDAEMHDVVRERCLDYMVGGRALVCFFADKPKQPRQAKNRDHFAQFVSGDFDAYLQHKRHPACHGNHLEIQAMSEIFNRNIEVFSYGDGAYHAGPDSWAVAGAHAPGGGTQTPSTRSAPRVAPRRPSA